MPISITFSHTKVQIAVSRKIYYDACNQQRSLSKEDVIKTPKFYFF